MYADVTDVISLFNFSITPYIQGRDAVRVSGSTNFDSRTVLDILATLVWRCRAPAKETRSSQNMNATSSQETHQSVISNWGQWVPRWLIPRKHDKLGGFWKITHVTDTMCMMFTNMFVKFIHVPFFTVFPRKPLVVVVELAAFWVCLGSTGIFWFGLLLHNTVRLL